MNNSIEKTKLVDVAAAVLLREDGSFLLAQRPTGKVYEGYWEFPGGKIEAGETPLHALCRELHEELGITVITAYPWLTRVFAYHHATVRLHFFRVFAWQGEPHPHEGQVFSWQRPLSLALPMNLKFFVGWANSFIRVPDQKFYGVCPRGTRYEKPRGHTQRVREPLRGKSVPTLRAPVHGAQFGRKIGDCGLSRKCERGQVTVSPLLSANAPILRALELPGLYAISNAAELGCEEFMRRLKRALQNGLRLLQVREKSLSGEVLAQFTEQAVQLAHRYGARVLVNGDAELAERVGADGVHFTGTQLHNCQSRPAFAWCSASCHNATELQRAGELGFDFALLSPVLPTQSHPGAAHLGWGKFAEMVAGTTIPVYALGGLTAADLSIAQQHGAHGIALLRQAW